MHAPSKSAVFDGAADAAGVAVRPSDFTVEEPEGRDEPHGDDDDPTRKRLQFWSR